MKSVNLNVKPMSFSATTTSTVDLSVTLDSFLTFQRPLNSLRNKLIAKVLLIRHLAETK